MFRKKEKRMEGVGRVEIDILPDGLKVKILFPEVSEMDPEEVRQAAIAIGKALYTYSSGDGRARAHFQSGVGEECSRTEYRGFGELVLRVMNAIHDEEGPPKPVVPPTKVFAPLGE